MAYTIKRFDQIVQDMVSYIISNSSQISDLTPGSVIRSFCEATSLSLEEVYVAVYLGFRRQLRTIHQRTFDFPQKTGVKSSTEIRLSRTGTTGDVTIPSGTEIATGTGLTFLTTAEATISDGDTDSNLVGAEAEEVGSQYNVPGGSITVIVDDTDADTVTNPNAAVNGVDAESELAYRRRFLDFIEGLGRTNRAGLRAGALSVEGITSVSVEELFPPVSNVNVRVYVDDGSSNGVDSEKVTEVQSTIDGDGTDENPGYRGAGVNVEVLAPAVVTQNIELDVTTVSGIDSDQVDRNINTAITNYINGLGVGEDIIVSEIIAACMDVFGVTDTVVTTPASNVSITSSQVGRVGTITANITGA